MMWIPKKLSREQMAERRAEGVRLLETGEKSQVQIARELGVSEAAVSVWNKKLQEKGPQALEARKASGRPAKLSQADKQKLEEKLKQGALTAGFPTEQWAGVSRSQTRVRLNVTKN